MLLAFRVLLLSWILFVASSPVFGRVWTSRDGKTTLRGNFVKLESGIVTIQTDSARTRDVLLTKLSETDQTTAKQLAEAAVTSIEMRATGVGLTAEDALSDAYRNAVQQAVGALVDAQMVVKNDQLVEDRILVFSDGFVRSHLDISTQRVDGLFQKTIVATVEQRQFASRRLKSAASIDVSDFFAQAETRLRRYRIGMMMLQDTLDSFGDQALKVDLKLTAPEILPESQDRVRLPYEAVISMDPERYVTLQKRLEHVLGAIAIHSGRLDVTHRIDVKEKSAYFKRLFMHGVQEGDLKASFGPIYKLWKISVTGVLPEDGVDRWENRKTLICLCMPGSSGDSKSAPSLEITSTPWSTHWKWYLIDGDLKLSAQEIDIVVRLSNARGDAEHEERFALGPQIPGISVCRTTPKLTTIMVSPLFLHHISEKLQMSGMQHAVDLTVRGKAIVSLDDLKASKTIKGLAVGKRVKRLANSADVASSGADTKNTSQTAGNTGTAVVNHNSDRRGTQHVEAGKSRDAAILFRDGTKEYNNKQYAAAISKMKQAVKLEPQHDPYRQGLTNAYLGRAKQLQGNNDRKAIVRLMNEAIGLLPNKSIFYGLRGISHYNTRSYQAAILDLNVAIRSNPKNKQYYLVRGYAYIAVGQKERGQRDIWMSK